MSEKRVLVVDDNPVNLKLTAALVRRAGFIADVAESAEQAMEMLLENRADLIVTDLNLPGMNGLELTRKLKRKAAWKSIPVILLTAADSAEERQHAQEAGCECLVAKPVNTKLFPSVIAGMLGNAPAEEQAPTESQDLPIAELRREFLQSGAAECRRILAEFSTQRLFVQTQDYTTIRQAVHRWAGVGGTIGYPDITTGARKVEALLTNSGKDVSAELRQALANLLDLFLHAKPVEPVVEIRPKVRETLAAAPTRKPVVLVADDDPAIRAVLREALEAAGMECRLADDGVLTFAMARNDPPDAIILDVNMPRMTGFQVLYSLRNVWSTRYIPVILLTALDSERDVVEGVQLGASDYMTKPFEVPTLLARVERLVRRG